MGGAHRAVDDPDVAAGLDVRAALARLPFANVLVWSCGAFDLSEKEAALALGISVGTVKSQTSKGMAELRCSLSAQATGELAEGGFSGRHSQASAEGR